jgi:hypothetical protein
VGLGVVCSNRLFVFDATQNMANCIAHTFQRLQVKLGERDGWNTTAAYQLQFQFEGSVGLLLWSEVGIPDYYLRQRSATPQHSHYRIRLHEEEYGSLYWGLFFVSFCGTRHAGRQFLIRGYAARNPRSLGWQS